MIQLIENLFVSNALSDSHCNLIDIACREIDTIICLSPTVYRLFDAKQSNWPKQFQIDSKSFEFNNLNEFGSYICVICKFIRF
jgi:hypothetical protein